MNPESCLLPPWAGGGSVFDGPGFATPWPKHMVPFSVVESVLDMARDALSAKQAVIEVLQRQLDAEDGAPSSSDPGLVRRVERAETDSGALVGLLESLMSDKSTASQQLEDAHRITNVLMAERELLCEQLDVDATTTNLCQVVEGLLAEAAALRRDLLAAQEGRLAAEEAALQAHEELGAAREREAAWQAREAAYVSALCAAGAAVPPVTPRGTASADGALLSDEPHAPSDAAEVPATTSAGEAQPSHMPPTPPCSGYMNTAVVAVCSVRNDAGKAPDGARLAELQLGHTPGLPPLECAPMATEEPMKRAWLAERGLGRVQAN